MHGEPRCGVWPNVQNQIIVGHLCGQLDTRHSLWRKGFCGDDIAWNRHRGAARIHGRHDRAGLLKQSGLGQALANVQAAGQHKGVGNAAAHNQLVHFVGQAFEDGEFCRYLGACHDSHQRPLGLGQRQRDGVHLGSQQRPGASHCGILGNAIGRGLGTVCSAKGVMHKNIAQRGHFARQRFAVFFLAHIHAAVFKQHQLAGLDRYAINPVGVQGDRAAKQLSHALGHRRQGISGAQQAFGRTAEVRGDHHRSASLKRQTDTGQRGPDAGVFGDGALRILRHIEVGADKNTLPGDPPLVAQVGKTDDFHNTLRNSDKTPDFRNAFTLLTSPDQCAGAGTPPCPPQWYPTPHTRSHGARQTRPGRSPRHRSAHPASCR